MKASVFQLVSACLILSSASTAQAVTFTAGVADDFAVGNAEPAIPSQALRDTIDTVSIPPKSFYDFDEFGRNNGLAHTFDGLGSNYIAGSITFRVSGNPQLADRPAAGDGILLLFADATPDDLTTEIEWSSRFGFLDETSPNFFVGDPGLLGGGQAWTPTSVMTFSLDLTELPVPNAPSINLLQQINTNGYLDVFLADDSAIDFITLTLVVPEPSSAIAALIAAAVLFARRRVRG